MDSWACSKNAKSGSNTDHIVESESMIKGRKPKVSFNVWSFRRSLDLLSINRQIYITRHQRCHQVRDIPSNRTRNQSNCEVIIKNNFLVPLLDFWKRNIKLWRVDCMVVEMLLRYKLSKIEQNASKCTFFAQ